MVTRLILLTLLVLLAAGGAEARPHPHPHRIVLDDYTPAVLDGVVAQAAADWSATGVVTITYQRRGFRDDCTGMLARKREVITACGSTTLGPYTGIGAGPSQRGSGRGWVVLSALPMERAVALAVARHEIGHALGLPHSPREDSIMWPVTSAGAMIGPEDVTDLANTYAATHRHHRKDRGRGHEL